MTPQRLTKKTTAKTGSNPFGRAAKIIVTPPRAELRRRFSNYLTLLQLDQRTIESYTSWIYLLARFHHRSPELLGNEKLSAWFLDLT